MKAVLLNLQDEKFEELRQLAYEQKKTMSFILRQALREFLIKHLGEKKNGMD